MQGLAIASKYFSLSSMGILGLCFIWFSSKNERARTGIRKISLNGFLFGFFSLLIVSPWLLKNFFWTGNPVFPFYLPQHTINPLELDLVMDYLYSFGTGKGWFDYLFLPFNIFLQFTKFGTFMQKIEVPSPVFMLAIVYPFIRKRIPSISRWLIDVLSNITLVQFVFWALGSQQNRFLLPLFPSLSIIISNMVESITGRTRKIRLDRVIKTGLIGGMLIASFVIMLRLFMIIQPFNILANSQTKSQFLSAIINNYDGMAYVNTYLPSSARVLMPWDGRGYYCDNKCYPDVGPSVWTVLVNEEPNLDQVIVWLKEKNITHIFLSNADISFYLHSHDLYGDHKRALGFLLDRFLPNCAKEVYSDDRVRLFYLTLNNQDCC